ncbi:MAG: carboxypeptidase regulatory-like domain-containing protein [Bryobacteraceae bacterium]
MPFHSFSSQVLRHVIAASTLIVSAPGQTFYGSIVGTVSDASGGVVPGATVNLTNNGTGERRTASTATDGAYWFVNLVPGVYRVGVEQARFKRYTREQVEVNVEAAVRADIVLEVGEVSQSVEVTSEVALLQTENASLSQVVASRSVEELPLNGRNILNLVALVPGVVPQGSSEGSLTGKNVFAAGNYQIGGGLANQSATLYDGIPVNISYGNATVLVPSQDAVSEFRVQTNNLSAEYGRFTGGVINLASRSGTNEWHGGVYEFLRNTHLNASTFFGNATNQGKAPFHQNQFGANGGGPIRKDRTFIFGSYEGYRQREGVLFSFTVPTAAMLAGDFSNRRDTSGALTPIYDPDTQCGAYDNAPCSSSGPQRQLFPENRIPKSRIHPVSKKYIEFPYWGKPNVAGLPYTEQQNFAKNAATGGNNDQVNIRGDENVSEKQHLLARYTRWKSANQQVDIYGNGLLATDPYAPEWFVTTQGVLADTYSLNQTTIFDIRLGFTRWFYDRTPGTAGIDIPEATGLPNYYNQLDELRGLTGSETIPAMRPTGFNAVGTAMVYGVTNSYTITPSLIKIVGRHTLKMGGDVRRMDLNYYQDNNAGGQFSFSNLYTSRNALNAGATGDSFASFLLGLPASGSVQTSLFTATGLHYQGYYFNDTSQATNKLTLNLGLRWEIPGQYTERFDRQTTFEPGMVNPVLAQAGIKVNGVLVLGAFTLVNTPDHPERGLRPEYWHLLAPRVGIAYRLSDRTVIRTGGGMFFIPADVAFAEGPCQSAVTYITENMVSTIDNGTTYVNTLTNPYPNGWLPAPGRDPSYQYMLLGQSQIRSPLRTEKYGYTYQWNFSLQHRLPRDVAFEASYSGLRGMHLFRGNASMQRDVLPGQLLTQMGASLRDQVANPFYGFIETGTLAQKTVQRAQLLLPHPQYQSLYDFGGYVGDTNYHSLQMKAEKRFGGGGMLLASYTFSKSIGNAETFSSWLETGASGTGAAAVQDYSNLKGERSLSSFDARQRLTISYVLDLPVGKGKKLLPDVKGAADKLVSGWGINGMSTFQMGFPLGLSATPIVSMSAYGVGTRPNVVADCDKTLDGPVQQRLSQFFNTACFSVPPAYTWGAESRTDPNLRGNGINNFDFAVFKRTSITERYGLEFRLETFNLFNRVKFSNPGTTVTTAAATTFGRITAQANTPRLLQLALRLRF